MNTITPAQLALGLKTSEPPKTNDFKELFEVEAAMRAAYRNGLSQEPCGQDVSTPEER
jgi:hypothetical protein